MSNFNCEHCGTPILEGEGGVYVTWCEHHPLEPTPATRGATINELLSDITQASNCVTKSVLKDITKKRIDRL